MAGRIPGRGIPRPALFAGLALLSSAVAWALIRPAGREAERGPVVAANPLARSLEERVVGSVRYLVGGEPADLLLPDTTFPSAPAQLLWFEGRPAAPVAEGGALALDGAGGILYFDRWLNQRPLPWSPGDRAIAGIAQSGEGAFWLAGEEGELLQVDSQGGVRTLGHLGPFAYPAVAADPRDPKGGVWLVRRAQRWDYRLPDPEAPLLARLGPDGQVSDRVGHVVVPPTPFFAELASAGYLAAGKDTLYYSPFIRDEVYAFSAAGDTLWIADRELPQSVADPKVVVEDGRTVVDYHPVNLGLTVGPDDRLYVLSTPGFTTEESRLDVFDRRRGRLLRTARLPTATPTLAADRSGRVYLLNSFRLLTGIDPEAREPFGRFSLPLLGGGTLSSEQLAGNVVLINFWASWCTPCREEMPALDSLRRRVEQDYPDFSFVSMNEDVDVSAAAGFVSELGLHFPVLLGRGQLRRRYHYVGLPMTVLLDRQGRVVQRWSGFSGREQIRAIERVARRELEREAAAPEAVHRHH